MEKVSVQYMAVKVRHWGIVRVTLNTRWGTCIEHKVVLMAFMLIFTWHNDAHNIAQ